jgi:hypothetical protein
MKIRYLFLVVGFIALSNTLSAQKYNYYQIFMYNFTRYIQWPSSQQSGDFVIGVLGNSEVVGNLKDMASSKKVGSQKITVNIYKSVSEIAGCHMLFVPESQSKSFSEIMDRVGSTSTLIITEKPGLGTAGSAINFIVHDGKLKFELNKTATDRANLKVSGDLSKLAIMI